MFLFHSKVKVYWMWNLKLLFLWKHQSQVREFIVQGRPKQTVIIWMYIDALYMQISTREIIIHIGRTRISRSNFNV